MATSAESADQFVIARDGKPSVIIYAPGENRYAGERLADRLEKLTGARLSVAISDEVPAGEGGLIAVGTPDTNPVAREALAGDNRLSGLGEEGYLLKVAKWRGRQVLLAARAT